MGLTEYKRKQEFAGVRLTSPDKILYPEQGITKLELANYYRDVADWILPHVANRPLALSRCPEGQHKECFFQKHPGVGTPSTLRQIPVREKPSHRFGPVQYPKSCPSACVAAARPLGRHRLHSTKLVRTNQEAAVPFWTQKVTPAAITLRALLDHHWHPLDATSS